MAVIIKAGTDTSTTATTVSFDWYHTLVTGSNRMIVVCLGAETNTGSVPWAPSAVTYGGVSMTKGPTVTTTEASNNASSGIWYLKDAPLPADGSRMISVTGSDNGASRYTFGFCSQYNGVDQGALNAVDTAYENTTAADDTIENTISPVRYAWVISTYLCGNVGTSWSVGESQVAALDIGDGVADTCRFGVCELRAAEGTETSLSSTFNTTANRLTRAAMSIYRIGDGEGGWSAGEINGVTNLGNVNTVVKDSIAEVNTV